ncbi:MAG: hypothetical protein LWX07_12865 [Bacteroidetes bacterium]|nr:hypothetical protein [Bacteroidota bacterium]
MKNFTYRINFLVAILVTVSLVFACGKLKEIAKEETKKEDTKKEETKKEDTKKTESKDTESDKSEGKAKLYFCEQYKNGEEIGVSKRFTPGWLTVMVDLRPAGTTLGVGKVELRLTKIKDASGNSISEKIIKNIPFDVQADWDYTYFTDKTNLKFTSPGTYRVTCQKKDGTPIVSGEVEVVSE